MTVVDSNPLTINPDDLDRIEVLETWLSGKRAYQRAGRTVGTIG